MKERVPEHRDSHASSSHEPSSKLLFNFVCGNIPFYFFSSFFLLFSSLPISLFNLFIFFSFYHFSFFLCFISLFYLLTFSLFFFLNFFLSFFFQKNFFFFLKKKKNCLQNLFCFSCFKTLFFFYLFLPLYPVTLCTMFTFLLSLCILPFTVYCHIFLKTWFNVVFDMFHMLFYLFCNSHLFFFNY